MIVIHTADYPDVPVVAWLDIEKIIDITADFVALHKEQNINTSPHICGHLGYLTNKVIVNYTYNIPSDYELALRDYLIKRMVTMFTQEHIIINADKYVKTELFTAVCNHVNSFNVKYYDGNMKLEVSGSEQTMKDLAANLQEIQHL